MSAPNELKRRLRPGQVYRRKDLAHWSKAVERHLRVLILEGRLEKVSGRLYMAPRMTRFGAAPAAPGKLVETFLGDDRFLIVSPNADNGLGLGTTQLYNEPVVYNRKRHGRFELAGQTYDFRLRPSVPLRLAEEVLMVDLLRNPDRLAEDKAAGLPRVLAPACWMNRSRLAKALPDYGSPRADGLPEPLLAAGQSTRAASTMQV